MGAINYEMCAGHIVTEYVFVIWLPASTLISKLCLARLDS